jgi:translation initiation factor 1
MGKKTPKKTTPHVPPAPSLGGLMAGLGFQASAEEPAAPEPTASAPDEVDLARQGRLSLQVQRKGRGGKTVTLLQGVQAPSAALKQLVRDLGRALGTGARIEGDAIVIQGDARDRAHAWLTARGAQKVSR